MSAADFTPLLGEGYAFRDLIGQGGNGWVACMHQRSMDRDVAVKFLRDDLVTDPEFRRRFEREAKAIGRLTHNHIVHVHDFVVSDNRLAIVMQYVDGGSLATRMKAGITGREALRILRCVADALDYAHAVGLLHRDIKPHNILLQKSGHGVWLADFGLVKLADGTALTATAGQMMGTYQYMAPELLRGGRATTATDLYALAATAYQVLVGGGNPFPGGEGIRNRDARLRERPPVALLPASDAAAVYEILSRALAERPDERHATALELVDELAAAMTPDACNRAPAFAQDLSSPLARLPEVLDDEDTRLDTGPPARAVEAPARDTPDIDAEDAAAVSEPELLTIVDPVEIPTSAEPTTARELGDVDQAEEEPSTPLGDVDQADEQRSPRPRRSRRRAAVAIAATTGALLVAGAAAAQLIPRENKTPPASRPAPATLSAGAASFQAAAGTDASDDAKTIAHKTIGDLQTSALTAAGTPADGIALALIDAGRTALTPASSARGRVVDLAAGGRGRRFTNAGVTTVIAQTSTQVVRLACTTAGQDCDRAIATLKLNGAQLQADPIANVQTKLAAALEQPASSRRRLELPRRDLTRRGYRARSIAKAYRSARDQVSQLAAQRPRDRDLPKLADRLDAAAEAFAEISDAARNRSTPGDDRGRRALASADAALRSSRQTLTSRGYTLTWPSTSAPAAAVIERTPTSTQSAGTSSASSSTSTAQSNQSPTQQSNTPSNSSSQPSSGNSSSSSSGSAFCDTGPC